jgi:hypothetical protein
MIDEFDEQNERPRPRVVDKRISARGATEPIEAAQPPTDAAPPVPEPKPEPSPPPGPDPSVWTPQQEAEARRIAQEIAETPSLDWVVNTAVTLANVAATKIELGDPNDAGLAIDALSGLVDALGGKLGEAEAPLRQTIAQLQLAYTERLAPPPT